MKFLLIGSCLLFCYTTAISTEGSNSTMTNTTNINPTEKISYPKKVSSTKKNLLKTNMKKVADITEKFRDLPTEDLAFIKELDKQFKLHGGKVRIKVENKNISETKNSKRTIDQELGYGYQYNPPKFMFYPYSQQNIGSNDPKHFLPGNGKSEVSIEPSYSYELKPQSYIAHNGPQIDLPNPKLQHDTEHFPQNQQQYEEPVIVLRIPGPAKYASHLQMLLQKYLEIRAAQYLRILEEAEQVNIEQQQQQQQQQQHHQLAQLNYEYGNNAIAGGPIEHAEQHQQDIPVPDQHDYTQVQYDHQNAMTPQTVQYPEIDNVYQTYKYRNFLHNKEPRVPLGDMHPYYSSQQNEEEQHTLQNEHKSQYQEHQYQHQQQVLEQPQFYYTHQQQYAQPEGLPADTYQQVFLVSMTQMQADDEVSQSQQEKQQPIHVQEEPNHNEHSLSFPIAENNPRPSHTKVVFTNKNYPSAHDHQMYQLPSIKPNERRAPTSTPDHHQDFQNKKDRPLDYQQQYNARITGNPEAAAITQRPYNYHAHSVKARPKGRTAHSRRAARANEADKDLQKIREYIRDKLGAETGSTVEFHTTHVING